MNSVSTRVLVFRSEKMTPSSVDFKFHQQRQVEVVAATAAARSSPYGTLSTISPPSPDLTSSAASGMSSSQKRQYSKSPL
ncbi:hypothetical protein HN51_012865, partial [Arachis hypogaea]